MSTHPHNFFPLFDIVAGNDNSGTNTTDICENYHRGNVNSIEANKFIAPKKSAMQIQILNYITSRGKQGATCQEVERDLQLKHQTASARCSELSRDFKIFRNGLKRALPGSQPAAVYTTSEGQL